jgi:hypothetical protein
MQAKRGSALSRKLDKLAKKRALWLQTGIPQMWDEIKHIEVRNFARGDVAGDMVPLMNFVIPHEECNVYGHGLALYSWRGGNVIWNVENGDRAANGYMASEGYMDTPAQVQQDFIKWLAKKIDHATIAGLGYAAKEIKKVDRRILVE